MIFKLNQDEYKIKILPKYTLKDIGWNEKDLQELLFQNIEKVLQDEELLLIMQSRQWQEEPDLMAVAANGDLYIFELKAWESEELNLLQALRYGQIFGQYSCESLNEIFLKFFPESQDLLKALNSKFNAELKTEDINRNQHFVVITNGLDYKTRNAILYWRDRKIDIRCWIYRIYVLEENRVFIEFNTFRIVEDPYEDLQVGSYILNTNFGNDPNDDADMLNNGKAAAYFDPWKRNIEKLQRNDKIFLYRSGTGIIAIGIVSGQLEKKPYQGNPKYPNEEYYMKLNNFQALKNPLSASNIKRITGINYRFMQTMFSIDDESSEKLWNYINEKCL
ncbi:MAG: hypothetical protein ACFFD4_25960 [Candidatus Odinarchaeota archaeon]